MTTLVRAAGLLVILLTVNACASAATPKEIDAAIKRGADALKTRYAKGVPGVSKEEIDREIGGTCLAGLAMLEAGVAGTDPSIKVVTGMVRDAAYTQTKTYQISLCLIYLDRYGDPNDIPLIQSLAVRLMVGQTARGGWSYDCIGDVTKGDQERLRAIKPGTVGKFHPDVEQYGRALGLGRPKPGYDDNSNTQFATIALWLSRKHGTPVDGALDLIENRFLFTQDQKNGGWIYQDAIPGKTPAVPGSPSMYCAGLLGLATGVARREERRTKAEQAKVAPPKTDPGGKKNPEDPFFNPPPKDGKAPEPKKTGPKPLDNRDRAVQAAFAGLGQIVADNVRIGKGTLSLGQGNYGTGNYYFYFLWSLERVGVIFGMDKIGGVDWYEAGAEALVRTQAQNGLWGDKVASGTEVSTSFAVLFLCKSNLARDLSGKIQNESNFELKSGGAGGTETKPANPKDTTAAPSPVNPLPIGPATGNEAVTLAAELARANDKDWDTALVKLRDGKGTAYTHALVVAVSRVDGKRQKAVRDALAERLTRMTADTLRTMAKDKDEPELRRGAVLAMAMKDDKSHIPDLIAAIQDDEDTVVRAAHAGLKSLTGEDFGPAANATSGQKKLAADAWQQWLKKQKK